MNNFDLHPSELSQWHSLICDAEAASTCYLDSDLQSYVVFLLMRYVDKPDIAGKILALDYVDSLLQSGSRQHDKLRDVADTCLLYTGFFPGLSKRRRVSESYYMDLGTGAYLTLASHTEYDFAEIYQRMSYTFAKVTHLLQVMKSLGTAQAGAISQSPLMSDSLENPDISYRH